MKEASRVVVTGASRGLGLEFVRQFLEQGCHVHALLRKPRGSKDLQRLLKEQPDALAAAACNVADEGSVEKAAAAVRERWRSVDLLINNAGVVGDRSDSLRKLDPDEAREAFDINALGPILMTRHLLPLLEKGTNPKVINVTSLMGSMADNDSGGWWAYRMSKAALNMATVNMAHELHDASIATMVIHPGWVSTDMGGRMAPLRAADSVAGMIKVIDGLRLRNSGCFKDHTGAALPW